MKFPFFNIYLAYQPIEPLFKCPICRTILSNKEEKHKCENIAIKKLIRRRVTINTIKATIIAGLIGIVLGIGYIVTLQWQLIHICTDTIDSLTTEMTIINRVNALLVKTDPYSMIKSTENKDGYYEFIMAQRTNNKGGRLQRTYWNAVKND